MQRGQAFRDYVIDDVLGRGGSSTVYRAHNDAPAPGGPPGGHSVALKILTEDHRGPAETARLDREFDFARDLSHRHVVSVYRHGDYWLSMQLIDGGTVAALTSLRDRLAALAQIAEALDYVHRCGIVHCDVKPSNILVHQPFSDGGAVLSDFGVAYAVSQRALPYGVHASLAYLAPEILCGRLPSAATDLYALACTTVELVTGAPPFVADSPGALVLAQLYDPPPHFSQSQPDLPRAFDSKIGKAMAKDPELRYATCAEFVAAVAKVLG